MEEICNFVGESVRDIFEDLGLTEYYPGKITIETAKALARNRVVDKKDIPWCFIENVLNPSYDGRSIFYLDHNTREIGSLSEDSGDSDWETEACSEDEKIYSFLDVTVAVLLCCDNTCKQVLAHKLNKSELSVPIVLPDTTDKDKLSVQISALKGITQDVGFETHIPIVSFVCVNGDPVSTIYRQRNVNSLLSDYAHKPFFDFELEIARMGCASATSMFLWGLTEATLSRPYECTCHDSNMCSCTFKKVLLFLNLYGFSRDFKTQENLTCKISSLVTIFVDTGKLAGDNETIKNIKEIVDNSKQTLVMFTKVEEDSLDDCKKGVQELKEVISGTGAQVAVLYNRKTGQQDNVHLVMGNMRKRINSIMETIDSDDITLKEQFENLDIDNIKLEEE